MAPYLLNAAALALRASSAAICPALPICPQDDQCLFSNNGVTLQVSCATDYYGGDVALAQASTLSACLTACSKRSDCVAASYVGQNCYLKSTLNSGSANANVIGVAVTSRTPPANTPPTTPQPQTCPSSFACPQNDGCMFTGSSRSLALECGTDFYGGDLSNDYVESLQACAQACASTEQCVAASFVGGSGPGRCYLKNQKNDGLPNDGVDAVFVVTPSAQSSSSVVPSSSTVSPSSTDVSSSSTTATSPSETSTSTATTTTPSVTSTAAASPSETSTSTTTTTPSITSSSAAASSSDASSTTASSSTPAVPVPSVFCLRPTNVGSPVYGFLIRTPGPGLNLILEDPSTSNNPVLLLQLTGPDGLLVTADGNNYPFSSVPPPTVQFQNLRPYRQATINANPSQYPLNYCTISATRELKCVQKTSQLTWNLFAWNTVNTSLKISTAAGITAPVTTLNLGVFSGAQCVIGSRI